MTERRKIHLLTCGIILAVVLWLVFRSESEPSYGGKPLSKWAMQLQNPTTQGNDPEAVAAIRQIGTNAIPILLEWAQYQPPKWDPSFPDVGRYLRLIIPSSSPPPPRSNGPRFHHQYLAPSVFYVLGPQAKEAIPKLNQLMYSQNHPMAKRQAAYSLGYLGNRLGNEVAPLLIVALTNQQSSVRLAALEGIRVMGTNAMPALPTLIQTLNDKDEEVARWAVIVIGVLKMEPKISVPALISSMKDSRINVRSAAAAQLGEFGGKAQAAVPELINLFHNGKLAEQLNASNALRFIDPEALKRATQP